MTISNKPPTFLCSQLSTYRKQHILNNNSKWSNKVAFWKVVLGLNLFEKTNKFGPSSLSIHPNMPQSFIQACFFPVESLWASSAWKQMSHHALASSNNRSTLWSPSLTRHPGQSIPFLVNRNVSRLDEMQRISKKMCNSNIVAPSVTGKFLQQMKKMSKISLL